MVLRAIPWRTILFVAVTIVIATQAELLANSRADLKTAESEQRVLASDNKLQRQVIASQALNFQRFNLVAEQTNTLNSSVDGGTEKTVIKYREILRREKTCNFPVPDDIADGLLDYTNRLRANTMHTDSVVSDTTGDTSAAASQLTYCHAVLWIKPLLATIEKANNQLTGVRTIEKQRQTN